MKVVIDIAIDKELIDGEKGDYPRPGYLERPDLIWFVRLLKAKGILLNRF